MDKETIHRQIEILIETIVEQHESLKANKDYIAQIDMDIFLENIRDLYEFSNVLDKMNARDRKLILGPETVGETPTKKVEVKNTEPLLDKIDELQNTVNVINDDSEPNVGNYHPSKHKFIPKEKKTNKIVAGSLFEDTVSIVEDIKPKSTKKTSTKESHVDLIKAIGINEKFLIMNELFDGSLEDYNTTINQLNNCRDVAEAEQQIFLEFQPKYEWDMNSSTVKLLQDLINKRFSE